jgi:hypothetical protein
MIAGIMSVVEWEMYGPGSIIRFCGHRDGNAFELRVMRDDTTVVTAAATSAESLLRTSTQLRDHLHQHGYAVRPLASRASQLSAGPCWGPAAPLDSALLQSIR